MARTISWLGLKKSVNLIEGCFVTFRLRIADRQGNGMTTMEQKKSPDRVTTADPLDQLSINTIRTLSMDAVQQANSGHPGAPMGLAPVVYSLWHSFLQYDPADPLWPNRA